MISKNRMDSLIRKKELEVLQLEQMIQENQTQLREVKAYLQALQDMQRMLPKESGGVQSPVHVLRVGSDMAKARDAIKTAGKPLHIVDLVEAIGKENTKNNRVSLAGSIASYVRKGMLFTKSAPNTFYLVELNGNTSTPDGDPPEDFGLAHD